MKYQVVTIRDMVADTFGVPFHVPSKGSAIRSFSDEINRADENNLLYKHPDDYELYHLGTYNDEDATYELNSHAVSLALGRDVKIK